MLIKLDSIRNKFLKRVLEHIVYLIIMLVLIPSFFYFEVFIVIPSVIEQWSIIYLIHFSNAIFLLHNVVGNMIYGMFTDTSIRGKILISANKKNWTLCGVCECFRPPRSWHCNTCNICILKRDHHCTFFACCVGYFNHRYFLLFTMYVFISMIYAFYYNVIFVSQFITWNHGLIIVKFAFPLASFVVDFGNESLYVLLVVINIIVAVFTGFLFIYHFNNILKGKTAPEIKHCSKDFLYDKGWRTNLMEVFGTKWYLTWISAFIRSPLPGDGIQWDTEDKRK